MEIDHNRLLKSLIFFIEAVTNKRKSEKIYFLHIIVIISVPSTHVFERQKKVTEKDLVTCVAHSNVKHNQNGNIIFVPTKYSTFSNYKIHIGKNEWSAEIELIC